MNEIDSKDGRGDDMPIFIHSGLDDYGLSAIEFRVYARLARRCAGNAKSFESIPHMAAEFEVSVRTIQRALAVLTECNLITEQRRPGTTTIYTLNPQRVWFAKGYLKTLRVKQKAASGDTTACTQGGDTTDGGDTTAWGVVTPENGVVVTPQHDEGTPIEGTPPKVLPLKTKRVRAKMDIPIEFPEWLPGDVWKEWEQYNRERRKPLTPSTIRAQLRRLDRFRARGMPPEAVIEQAIANGWQGLFEIKETANGKNQRNAGNRQNGNRAAGSAEGGRGQRPAYQPWGESKTI